MASHVPCRHRETLVIAGLTLMPILVVGCAEAVLPSFELLVDDGPLNYQPPLLEAIRQVRGGHLPLWSESTYSGYPLLARGQPGSLYPVHHVAALMGSLVGLGGRPFVVSFVLHLALAGVCAFLLVRGTSGSVLAATMAGSGVALAGPALGICGSWPVLWLFVPWLCLSILCVHRICHQADGAWSSLLGLCIGMVALIGYPEGMLAFAIMLVTSTLVLLRAETYSAAVPKLLVAGIVGLGIGACQLLSTLQLAMLGRRAGGWDLQETTSLALQPVHLLGLLAPWMEVPFRQTGRLFPGGALFAGPWVVLGLLALVAARPTRRAGWAALTCVAVAVTLSLGTEIPGARHLFSVPPLSLFRWPIKHSVELALMVAVAGAVGISALFGRLDRRAAAVVLWIHFALQALAFITLPRSTVFPTVASAVALLMATLSLALPLLLHLDRRHAMRGVLLASALVLPVLNLPMAANARIDKIQRPKTVADLPAIGPDDRLLLLLDDADAKSAKRAGIPAYNLAHSRPGVERVLGHDALRPSYYSWLRGLDPAISGNVVDPRQVAEWLAANRLLPFVRAGLVIISRQQELIMQAARANPFLHESGTIAEFSLFTSSSPRPVAFLAEEVRVVGSAERAGRAFVRNDAPLRVVHAEGPWEGEGEALASGTVRVVERRPGRLVLEVQAEPDRGSFLVVTSSWYSGWRAVVDGADRPVIRVNGSFLGVPLPPGVRHVELVYRPTWLVLCCAFSGLLLVGTVGHLGACGWRRPRDRLARWQGSRPRQQPGAALSPRQRDRRGSTTTCS